jgi:AmmeMemoRadiSam system protein B
MAVLHDNVRPATHSGSWYTDDADILAKQLADFFKVASSNVDFDTTTGVPGARVLVGPHAGYAYSGQRLAETFASWDVSLPIDTIFILGPSHHVAFKHSALVSQYDYYETPFGNLPINKAISHHLTTLSSSSPSRKAPIFKFMDPDVDDDEHSFEMHAPFIYHRLKPFYSLSQMPKLVPILISSMDDKLCQDLLTSLSPYLNDKKYHFIISSDFCHWGARFAYTKYYANAKSELTTLSSHGFASSNSIEMPVYKSIELLDHQAMDIASKGSYDEWMDYISRTGNTICGQKPIALLLRMIQEYRSTQHEDESRKSVVFEWIGYSQSNRARRPSDSSVSYASGYVRMDPT